MADYGICTIPECDKKAVNGRGWCPAHYQRWRRHGSPTGGAPSPDTDWGEAKAHYQSVVLSYKGDDCLIWPYQRSTSGYAVQNGKVVCRLICEDRDGSPPSELHQAAHSCGNGDKGCVTPGHVRWATQAENEADKLQHGTSNRGRGYKLTAEDVTHMRDLYEDHPPRVLAKMFGISAKYVSEILSRRSWRWLE